VVLTLSFAAFFWISDIGFRRSIEVTVDDASRSNLETIKRLLARQTGKNDETIRRELNELSDLWANGALLEVSDKNHNWIFRSPRFAQPSFPLPPVRDREIAFFTTNLDSFQYRIALQNVETADRTFEIHAAVPTEPFDQALDSFRLIEKEASPLLILLASLLGYWLSGRPLGPMKCIIETAESIGAQNLSRRLQVPKARDELRRLTQTLNAMLERIETSFNKITQFTADASHDLRTPVAVMRTAAEITLRRPRAAAEYRDALSKILATSVETSDLLENLLTLARADAGALAMEMHPVDLGSHVRKAQERAALLSADKQVEVGFEAPSEPVWVKADAIAIDRLLAILLDNAVKYTPPGGRCEIALSQTACQAQISVRDSGIGIAPDDLKNIFDRFYRADRSRSKNTGGAGLGLAIARWITEFHGGAITVESEISAGSVFRVRLPSLPGHGFPLDLNDLRAVASQI
jgi:heavy metal sensor kinase